jgi:hypothetical protein
LIPEDAEPMRMSKACRAFAVTVLALGAMVFCLRIEDMVCPDFARAQERDAKSRSIVNVNAGNVVGNQFDSNYAMMLILTRLKHTEDPSREIKATAILWKESRFERCALFKRDHVISTNSLSKTKRENIIHIQDELLRTIDLSC